MPRRLMRVAHPKKKPRNGELTSDELARNARNHAQHTFKWGESPFDSFARMCFALTNFYTDINSLRADDGRFYRSVMGQYASMAERSRLASIQRRYRRRRDARLPADQNVQTRLSFSPSLSSANS
ncbi:hypothetical protein GN958_ATG15782 [Phytophthora infestans]|uniref:Uncharacterized protein n=1 Tax=Phytophthora infestans TaxID=4787 RepID=A0A8S9U270_PHYIN|nr:hypothetical protein GN958_ATG15782 [Phytophthora infestans]